jgi:cysteine desulfurase
MVYLDNAAATPVTAETAEMFARLAVECHANPESAHAAGKRSRKLIDDSAERLRIALMGENSDMGIYFTTSATEAINTALSFTGIASGTIVASPSLHPSVENAIARSGSCEIREVELDADGAVNCEDLVQKIDASVSAVVVEHTQNETGRIQDIAKIGAIVKKEVPDALFIADTVQSVGKLSIPWKEAGINIAFVGGHKIGVPCGGALLYRFPDSQLQSAKFAEHLQRLRYSEHILGRPDPAICAILAEGIVQAQVISVKNIENLQSQLRIELVKLANELRFELEFLIPKENSTPYITSFFILPYQGEILARMLSDEGVMVSSGSACESAGGKASRGLSAMGISDKKARSMIRISFSNSSSESDVHALIRALRKVIKLY